MAWSPRNWDSFYFGTIDADRLSACYSTTIDQRASIRRAGIEVDRGLEQFRIEVEAILHERLAPVALDKSIIPFWPVDSVIGPSFDDDRPEGVDRGAGIEVDLCLKEFGIEAVSHDRLDLSATGLVELP
jgi:hypothetical protein